MKKITSYKVGGKLFEHKDEALLAEAREEFTQALNPIFANLDSIEQDWDNHEEAVRYLLLEYPVQYLKALEPYAKAVLVVEKAHQRRSTTIPAQEGKKRKSRKQKKQRTA